MLLALKWKVVWRLNCPFDSKQWVVLLWHGLYGYHTCGTVTAHLRTLAYRVASYKILESILLLICCNPLISDSNQSEAVGLERLTHV